MSYTYGVTKPAYGGFKCLDCNRHWYSSKAWRDWGQKCQNCDEDIKPYKLWPLGRYNCFVCQRSWKTKFDENGCLCEKCGEKVYPKPFHERNPFIKSNLIDANYGRNSITIDPSKEHKRNLCEKCIYYKKRCDTITDEEMRRRPKLIQSYHKSINQLPNIKDTKTANAINFENTRIQTSVKLNNYSIPKNAIPIRSFAEIQADQQRMASNANKLSKPNQTSKSKLKRKTNKQRIASDIQNSFSYFAKSEGNSKTNLIYEELEESEEEIVVNSYINRNVETINRFANREVPQNRPIFDSKIIRTCSPIKTAKNERTITSCSRSGLTQTPKPDFGHISNNYKTFEPTNRYTVREVPQNRSTIVSQNTSTYSRNSCSGSTHISRKKCCLIL